MRPGDTLAHFTVQEQIGQGGMGAVFRATDSKLGREVALKVLPEHFAQDSERLGRFRREAQVLASLQHPNIASIYGIETVGEHTFLVMELCAGEDLSAIIDRGPLPAEEAREIARQIARGLEEAHEKGIIHRDLKPANVKVSSEGRVKILDFGLARTFSEESETPDASGNTMTVAASMTRPGVVLGTAAYMSPEQARGKGIDKRTDIWAFGVILFEMLTGRRLFAGDTATDILASVLRQDLDFDALPADLPLEMGYVVRRCLDRNRESRLRDIGEARCLVSQDASASSLSLLALPAESGATKRSAGSKLWPAVAVVLAVALVVGWFTGHRGQDEAADFSPRDFLQLTAQGHGEREGSLSPDGHYFAYGARVGDTTDIFLQRAGGLNPINLTNNPDSFDEQPAVSPDGQNIVFTSSRDGGGVYIMGATGESVRLLAAGGSYPAWSPDGQSVVYSTENYRSPWAREGDSEIWITDPAGSHARQLPLDLDAVQPNWSPDGTRLVFWSVFGESGQRDIWTVRADGSDLTRITEDAPVDWCPQWSPDGRWIFFLSNRGGSNNLWRIRVNQGSGLALGKPEMFTLPSPDVRDFALGRDGTRLVFTTYKIQRHLYRQDFDPVALAPVGKPRPLLTGSMLIDGPQVSADGQWLCFTRRGFKEDLYLMRTDGTGLRQLTDDVHRDRGSRFYDQDRRLIFYSDRGGKYDLWSIRLDGSDLHQLSDIQEKSVWFPISRPDKDFVVCFNEFGTSTLAWNQDRTALGPPQPLPGAQLAEQVFCASFWSPDGRYLLGWSAPATSGPKSWVTLCDPATEKYEYLAEIPGTYAQTGWISNRLIFYLDPEGIQVQDLDSGEKTLVMPRSDFPDLIQVVMAADGSAFFYINARNDSELWLGNLEP